MGSIHHFYDSYCDAHHQQNKSTGLHLSHSARNDVITRKVSPVFVDTGLWSMDQSVSASGPWDREDSYWGGWGHHWFPHIKLGKVVESHESIHGERFHRMGSEKNVSHFPNVRWKRTRSSLHRLHCFYLSVRTGCANLDHPESLLFDQVTA